MVDCELAEVDVLLPPVLRNSQLTCELSEAVVSPVLVLFKLPVYAKSFAAARV